MLLIAFKPIAFGIVAIAERWSSPPPPWFRCLAGLTFVLLLFGPLSLLFWRFGLRRSMAQLCHCCLACGSPRGSQLAERRISCGADLNEQDGYRRLVAEPSGIGDSSARRYRALRKRTPAGTPLRIASILLFASSALCVGEMLRYEHANPPRQLPDGKVDRVAYAKAVLLTGCALFCCGALTIARARTRDVRSNLSALQGCCYMCGRPVEPDQYECPNCSAWLEPQRLYTDWLRSPGSARQH